MQKSSINIDVFLDPQKVPAEITWNATDSTATDVQKAKAMCLAFWDGQDKTAMRIDLWTKTMMVDEMGDFYFQMMVTMADTFSRATGQKELAADMKEYAKKFQDQFRKNLIEQQNQ